MNWLAVDVGNSKTEAALVAQGRVVARGPRGDEGEALRWCLASARAGGIVGMALSSVVPAVTARWQREWGASEGVSTVPMHVIDHATPKPYAVRIEQPETVGADRWCNVAGAVGRGHRNALIVDLGTANTYDVLLDGVFEGGLIAPGLATAHLALVRAGARLPSIPFAPTAAWLGRTTERAITAGSWHQGVGGISHVLAGLRSSIGELPVLLTGGLATVAAPALTISAEVLPDLTLEGAGLLASRQL